MCKNRQQHKSLDLKFPLLSFSMCSTSTFVHLHGVEWIHTISQAPNIPFFSARKLHQIQGAARDGLDNGWALLLLPANKLCWINDGIFVKKCMWDCREYLLKKNWNSGNKCDCGATWRNLFHFFSYLPYLSADTCAKTSNTSPYRWSSCLYC